MYIIDPNPITEELIATGPSEPSMPVGGILWAPGPYPSAGPIRLRPNSRSYQVKAAHDSSSSGTPPELDSNNWTDLGPTPIPVEVAWVAFKAIEKGDVVVRAATHRRYRAAKALLTSENTLAPELDPATWVDAGPTNRHAPFDHYVSTRCTGTTSITYTINTGYINALAMYGLVGDNYTVVVREGLGGTVVDTRSGTLLRDSAGWYDYLFGRPVTLTRLLLQNLPPRSNAHLTITISAATDAPVEIGSIVLGDAVPLAGSQPIAGGTQYGSTAEPITYSYIKTDEYGQTTIVKRHTATNMRCSVVLQQEYADIALQKIQSVMDKPAACFGTSVAGYDGLNVFGLIGQATLSYDNYSLATIDITVKGLI